MGHRNNSIILFSVLLTVCSLAFQNCSSLKTIVLLNVPLTQAQSKKDNPLYEMMNYSEQQIKDTRQKLEKRNQLFGEESLENLKVGAGARVNQESLDSLGVVELEGTDLTKSKKRQIATEAQSIAPSDDEDLSIEDVTMQKRVEKKKEGK